MSSAAFDREALQRQYLERCPQYRETLDWLRRDVEAILAREGIQVTTRARLKDFAGCCAKLERRRRKHPGCALTVPDLLGLRVICRFLGEVNQVLDVLQRHFRVIRLRHKGAGPESRLFGYRAVHLLVAVPEVMHAWNDHDERLVCEIQLRTVLQDAWAEIEHGLVYKGRTDAGRRELRRRLAAINATLTLLDLSLQEIGDALPFPAPVR